MPSSVLTQRRRCTARNSQGRAGVAPTFRHPLVTMPEFSKLLNHSVIILVTFTALSLAL